LLGFNLNLTLAAKLLTYLKLLEIAQIHLIQGSISMAAGKCTYVRVYIYIYIIYMH